MSDNITRVLSFGEDVSGTSGLIKAEIDVDMHLDGDGKAKSSFLPNEEVFVLVHHDPDIKIVRVRDTADGDLQLIGSVTRSRTQEPSFTNPDDKHELPHIPKGMPTAKWYGRNSELSLSGRSLQAVWAPCLGDITYNFVAMQYKYRLPVAITVVIGDPFPVDLVVESEPAGGRI
jgi:hypothetical protein